MNIYSPISITESLVSKFKPCRLYIKELEGMKYFGKTSRDPYKYTGSGIVWKDRIKKYGKANIKTIWVSDWFYDPQTIQEYALKFSKDNKIVESSEWANLRAENGINGGIFVNPGYEGAGKKSAETKRKKGILVGINSEGAKKMVETRRERYGSMTVSFNTPERQAKAKEICNNLTNRAIVQELRELNAIVKTKLGSGWVRKPDQWILSKIDELRQIVS